MESLGIIEAPSPNQEARPAGMPLDMLVLHYTGMPTGAVALERLRDPAARVSAHYLVEEDGRVFRLVPDDRRAWHAGVAFWRGCTDINSRSIGVEIVNPGHAFGYRPFPMPQMAAVATLCRALVDGHGIPAWGVVGHSDIAPTRKEDPGELFDWCALARHGIGVWPDDATQEGGQPLPAWDGAPADTAAVLAGLGAIGYDLREPQAAIVAFQRRYCRHRLDGGLDALTERRVRAVLAALDGVGA